MPKKFIKKPALAPYKISRASSPGRVSTALDDLISNITEIQYVTSIFTDIKEPVGFRAITETTLTVNDATRTLTLAPAGTEYMFFVGGVKFISSQTKTVVWPNTQGLHYFYLNEDGVLSVTNTFTTELITNYAFVSIIYWDQAQARHIYFAEERHGVNMPTAAHLYNHTTKGTAFDNGLKLNSFSVDGGGSLAAHAQFQSASGVIWDEDIRLSIPAQTIFPVYYRSGTVWKQKMADSFPLIYSGTGGYAGPRIPYNSFDGTNWGFTPVDNNKWVLVHVFASNDKDYPVCCIQGQAQYNSKAEARNAAYTELQQLSGMPFLEFAPLGSVIYETRDSFTNTPKAIVVSTDTGENYVDHRGVLFRPSTL